jgi:peptide/nickel transport system permease protein
LFKSISTRLLYGLVSILFIAFVTFIIDEVAPGDAALLELGDKATPQTLAIMRAEMGLDRPWPVRFGEFVIKATQLDFGMSYAGVREPVRDKITRALPTTMQVAFLAICLAAIIGLTLGTISAIRQNKFADRAALSLSTLGVTIPNFVLAPILVYVFAVQLNYLPTSWAPPDRRTAPDIFYLLLPVLVMAARPAATLTRLTRASMIDILQQEFIRLAVAKGVPPFRLIFLHGLRNAILPVVTAIGTSFGFLLTGSFVVETVFVMPGLGSLAIDAVRQRDTPVILATTLVAGVVFVLVNLAVDLILPILDPRIRESQV